MSAVAKNICPRTYFDWLGLFCFFGSIVSTIVLSCLGIGSILKKGLYLEAIDATHSMLKLMGLNCGLLAISLVFLYICPHIILALITILQHFFISISAYSIEMTALEQLHGHRLFMFLINTLAGFSRPMFRLGTLMECCTFPFVRRAAATGITLPLLMFHGLSTLFIIITALGTFGFLANPTSDFDKMAALIIVSSTILFLAIVARLLRVLHTSNTAYARGLLKPLGFSNPAAYVISHHLGSAFFHYALLCVPLIITAIAYIWTEDWRSVISLTNPLVTVPIFFFPIFDGTCGASMLIQKKSIWDEWSASICRYIFIPACSVSILLLQNTSLISSFGTLFFARIFGWKLFGTAQTLNPYSIMTCTIIYIANNILCANTNRIHLEQSGRRGVLSVERMTEWIQLRSILCL